MNIGETGFKTKAYLLSLGTSISWVLFCFVELNMFYHSQMIQPKIKQTLIFLIFKKVGFLTQFVLNQQQVGKIINILSSDFNLIEKEAYALLTIFRTVFNIIGTSFLLYLKLGWIGMLSVLLLIIIIAAQLLIGYLNSMNLEKINHEKDKRIKLYS